MGSCQITFNAQDNFFVFEFTPAQGSYQTVLFPAKFAMQLQHKIKSQ